MIQPPASTLPTVNLLRGGWQALATTLTLQVGLRYAMICVFFPEQARTAVLFSPTSSSNPPSSAGQPPPPKTPPTGIASSMRSDQVLTYVAACNSSAQKATILTAWNVQAVIRKGGPAAAGLCMQLGVAQEIDRRRDHQRRTGCGWEEQARPSVYMNWRLTESRENV